MTHSSRASVAIVNYGTDEYALSLVEDLAGQEGVELDVAVVNTGASQLTSDCFPVGQRSIHTFKLHGTPHNTGYIGAVKWALGKGILTPRYPLVVSNADVRVPDSRTLRTLLDTSGGMCVAPQVRDVNGRTHNPYLRRRPSSGRLAAGLLAFSTYRGYLAWHKHRQRRPRGVSPGRADSEQIWAPYGAFFVLSPSFFERGGQLPHTFLFGEEEILGEEIARVGGRVIFASSVAVEHVGQVSTGAPSKERWRLQRRAAASVLRHRLLASSRAARL